jgi:hypothetical protein
LDQSPVPGRTVGAGLKVSQMRVTALTVMDEQQASIP